MEDWQYIESRFDDLGDQLETAKAHILKVHLDFETRIRVWENQVLVDRLQVFKKHPDLKTAIRYYDLTVKDVTRLYRRATKEFLEVVDNVKTDQEKLKFYQKLYLERRALLLNIHDGFVNELRDIVEG